MRVTALLVGVSLVACGNNAAPEKAPQQEGPKPDAPSVDVKPASSAPTPSTTSSTQSASSSPPAASSDGGDGDQGRGEGIGLGTIGAGVGGGGHGDGIGLGSIGGGSDAGAKASNANPPSIRQGATAVNGRLPPEVIQRIVRQNFGRFRLCYDDVLKTNAKASGRVAIKFVIDQQGNVMSAPTDGGSDFPSKAMIDCVIRAFATMRFPQPEGGIVTVVYPLIFDPPAPATKPKK